MKRFKQITIPIMAAIGLYVLILDTKTAVSGAQEGIQICIKTLIPSLFPFFMVSGLFCSVYSGINLTFLNPILRLCHMPNGSGSLLVVGLLGGYPVGAKAIADSQKEGNLDLQDARRMMCFCNNAGPSFIFGILSNLFENALAPWILLFISILSAIITGWLLPVNNQSNSTSIKTNRMNVAQIFNSSIRAIVSVCGWIILFRVILSFLKRWFLWAMPSTIQVIIAGVIELANGCLELGMIDQDGVRFVMAAVMLSFGGLCVYLQTAAVAGQTGTGLYFPGKVLQSLIALVLAGIGQLFLFSGQNRMPFIGFLPPTILLLIIVIVVKTRKIQRNKNNCSILHLCDV